MLYCVIMKSVPCFFPYLHEPKGDSNLIRWNLKLLLDYVLSFPDGEEDAWSVSYDQEDEAAMHLYASFGFVPNGEKDSDDEDAEEVAVLPLK